MGEKKRELVDCPDCVCKRCHGTRKIEKPVIYFCGKPLDALTEADRDKLLECEFSRMTGNSGALLSEKFDLDAMLEVDKALGPQRSQELCERVAEYYHWVTKDNSVAFRVPHPGEVSIYDPFKG